MQGSQKAALVFGVIAGIIGVVAFLVYQAELEEKRFQQQYMLEQQRMQQQDRLQQQQQEYEAEQARLARCDTIGGIIDQLLGGCK